MKYGRRNFKGNPLRFFREHPDVYADLSRKGLYHFDHPLYESLREHGQLDEAIPILLRRQMRGEDEITLIAAHRICDSAKMVADALSYDQRYVLKVWHRYDLPLYNRREQHHKAEEQSRRRKNNGGQFLILPLEEQLKIVGAYFPSNKNGKKAAKALGRSMNTIISIWRYVSFEIGSPGGNPGNRGISPQQRQEINALYGPSGGNAVYAESISPYKRTTITKYWRLEGKEIHKEGQRKKEERINFHS